ncbi:maleylpyruvate isomerase family mycothiol-dependent enzyme [Streptomyces sp. R302]|uniref:maleylpyruvate isomerase family mycothiol-dependent enzyme n=1 Tax=unclassified Streptomyces TaxID=2593676 RepID=UPI00145CD91F|nr:MULTISPECIES: maleylpyruvate isomerase family mycothiol-dependent enzyme [unclassified Streptomyces]NML53934.1 maleylpyruvate isomerase family mycothiol-dependent enzyme [Streptomyces sp. R301]NML83194.1 maleylpyruvate isomerase family mycothiol-dependent enzyme [Streptomyces sp. R302]
MPPARKRTRSYDSARTRAAVSAQFGHVRDAVLALPPEALDGPTRLGAWTVRELAAHITMVLGSVVRGLAAPEPAVRELALLDWPRATATGAAGIDEDVRALDAADLPGLYARVGDDFAKALADADGERLVPTRFGAMTLADFLVTRTVELVVHTDDLAAATGTEIPYDRQALAACTRLLADALAAKAPGGAVEVRVPPYAVVQCVEGPRHTRGTPPNVVETDPLTWIRLATGRTDWAVELDAARIAASGERADLAGLLPVMG